MWGEHIPLPYGHFSGCRGLLQRHVLGSLRFPADQQGAMRYSGPPVLCHIIASQEPGSYGAACAGRLDTGFCVSAGKDGPGCGLQEQPQPGGGHDHQGRKILRLETGEPGLAVQSVFSGHLGSAVFLLLCPSV